VPRLWSETVDAHRRQVREAILDATAALVAEQGLLSVKMAGIAEKTGIGRATLYNYFPDVEAILVAWHERQISGHLEQLGAMQQRAGDPDERLEAVLTAYALMAHESHGGQDNEIVAFLHRNEHVAGAQQLLLGMIRDLIAEGAQAGDLRDDVPAEELANFCLHALAAAGNLRSRASVHRLVAVTMSGLQPTRPFPDAGEPPDMPRLEHARDHPDGGADAHEGRRSRR
jgi:AcrR family transcriptional regulator